MSSTPGQGGRPFNVYLASESVGSLDSFEGIPEIPVAKELPGRRRWQRSLFRRLDQLGDLAPGLLLAIFVAWVATLLSRWLGIALFGMESSPISPILVTVLLGLIIRNTIGLPACYREGLTFCVKVILRVGVALLGLRLSLMALGQIGLYALPIVIGCISVAVAGVLWLGKRAGISRTMSSLIAVGTSICGVSAIVATGPAVGADDEEVSYAVAVITVFGMLGLITYPFLAHWMFQGDPTLAGFFLGTSIHDTSQVAGAGLMYQTAYNSPEALEVATITKLVRNVCMGAVIPILAIMNRRQSLTAGARSANRLPLRQLIPGFVIAFVVLAAVRSLGDIGTKAFGILPAEIWQRLLSTGAELSLFCLTLALAAIGLGTSMKHIRELGLKPMFIGMAAAVLVALTSRGLIFLVLGG